MTTRLKRVNKQQSERERVGVRVSIVRQILCVQLRTAQFEVRYGHSCPAAYINSVQQRGVCIRVCRGLRSAGIWHNPHIVRWLALYSKSTIYFSDLLSTNSAESFLYFYLWIFFFNLLLAHHFVVSWILKYSGSFSIVCYIVNLPISQVAHLWRRETLQVQACPCLWMYCQNCKQQSAVCSRVTHLFD